MKELKVAERIFRKRKTSSYAISGYKIDQCDTRFLIEPTSKMLSFSCQMHSWRSRVWYKHPRYQNPFLFFMLLSFHMIEKKMQCVISMINATDQKYKFGGNYMLIFASSLCFHGVIWSQDLENLTNRNNWQIIRFLTWAA